jgi:glycosyltransferase involved in cell wall biosynthesis
MNTNPKKPSVSVILPVFNGERFLVEALQSILAQHYDPIEIIVVDDGSTDDSAKIINNSKGNIHYIYQRNRGPAAARNEGISVSTGEIIAFLDSDDLWPEGKLDLQVKRLVDEPSLDVVLGRIQYIRLPGAEELKYRLKEPIDIITNVHLGSALFRKPVFEKVGFFNESLRFNEDTEWFFRARENNISMVILKDVTLHYRMHSDNMTRGRSNKEMHFLQVLKQSLDRRRSQGGGNVRNLASWFEFDEANETDDE